MKAPADALSVELTFLAAAAGGRSSGPPDLQSGQYCPLVTPGWLEGPLSSDSDHQLFGVTFMNGPRVHEVGTTAAAVMLAPMHPEGLEVLRAATRFSVCEGERVVARGRVIDERAVRETESDGE